MITSNDCKDIQDKDFADWAMQSTGTIYSKSGVQYSVTFLQGEEPDKIPGSILQTPLKAVVLENNGTSDAKGTDDGADA